MKKNNETKNFFPPSRVFFPSHFYEQTYTQAHVVLVGTHLDDKYLDPQTLKKQLTEVRALYHPQVAPGASPPGMCILCVVYVWTFKRSYVCVCLCVLMRVFLRVLYIHAFLTYVGVMIFSLFSITCTWSVYTLH